MEQFTLVTQEEDIGWRLDKYLSHHLPTLSRTRIQSLIDDGLITIDGIALKSASRKIKEPVTLVVTVPEAVDATPIPQDIPLNIVYEDDDVLVLNKQAGLVVHPAAGHYDETLVNALLAHCGDSLSGIGGVKRPGIVHRLDKDTTGLMVIAKNDAAHQGLSAQFEDRSLSRTYHALVWGMPSPAQGVVDAPIGRCPKSRQKMRVLASGKPARTHYKILKTSMQVADLRCRLSLIECVLETGRTHQIRVHLHHIGYPLLGDQVYGHAPKTAAKIWPAEVLKFSRQALHAVGLRFIHPKTGAEMTFSAPYPEDFEDICGKIYC